MFAAETIDAGGRCQGFPKMFRMFKIPFVKERLCTDVRMFLNCY